MFSSLTKVPQFIFSSFYTFLAPPQRILSKGCCRQWRHSMSVNAKTLLKDGILSVDGKDALRGVPENVVVTPFTASSAFIGASCSDASSRLVFKLGVIHLSEGGTPAKFLIIDDGWQDTVNEFQKDGEPFIEGSQFGGRLISIKENNKFRAIGNVTENGAPVSLKDFVSEIKSTFGLNSKQSAITRASDDYYPKNTTTQSLHIAAVAFNSIFLGEIVVPDWDMFYSLHDAAEFHAAARAVGGCGVYVSDKPGQHDFNVLKKLVLPDGSVLRARYPIKVLQCEVFTVSPIKVYNQTIQFAPIGLTNMYNSGGAVEAVEFSDSSESKIHIRGRGEGEFGAYSNFRPKSCSVNSEDLEFKFREEDKLFAVTIPAKTTSWDITICY
ncbi:probable galactinol--sucrose galactosyltransferase 2 isoform X2 [Vigna radiata var. radiata]|uniref:Probable galactinol--sucrose galactosyltransferase 2 isoform X2 n=1 Tax=Vigna radiata var. radiata TaxID=3916 RepID=A0A3Q0FJN8_VIGRR|nr:probable galactinol--sucrose galactosyltransferase 2 isoform X2 [Vigna radiata var. radiata]